jgi:3-deoxy-D-manno-octulosonate 8-phosphate phosphatase KdsC-like HAD superfamily phosphatase
VLPWVDHQPGPSGHVDRLRFGTTGLTLEEMRFMALACDYDGTLASHDRIAPPTVAALERARRAGLRLALVTGRTFFELSRVCDRLDLFDAVVAENGGVLYFPAAGRICDMAVGPPAALLAELERLGIPYQTGRVVIGTMIAHEAAVRRALITTGVTMALVPNRTSLMLLPHGVSKSSGVRPVIGMLGLSPRDVLALGDAENDLELFEACGFSGCPGNAVAEVKARADWVFPGEDGAAIAAALDDLIVDGGLSLPTTSRHRLRLGWAPRTAAPATVSARAVNLLVQGDPQSGKSWLTGALVERLAGDRYATCVIDPEGDYQVLAALPGVTWMVVQRESEWSEALFVLRHDPSATVVVDVSGSSHAEKVRLVETGLRHIRALRRERGVPHWVVLDEAHYSLHPEGVSHEAFGVDDRGFCLVTHRASWLRPLVVDTIDTFVLARTTRAEELSFLRGHLPGATLEGVLGELPEREFLLAERDGKAMTFVPPPRLTSHVRHLHKYSDRPLAPHHRFLFRARNGSPVMTAGTLGEFVTTLGRVDDEVLDHHAARGDFSRWVLEVFGDRVAGAHLRKIERRWACGEIGDLRQALAQPLHPVAPGVRVAG